MTSLIRSHSEKLLLILTGMALLVSGGWCWRREAVASFSPFPMNPAAADYRLLMPVTESAIAEWNPPVAQPAGADWVFEVFSPPLIQRDAGTEKFVAGTAQLSDNSTAEPGIRLLAIRAIPYRVQLQGGFEFTNGYVAALVAVDTKEVWCGRPGERWAAMAIVLESTDVGIEASSFARATVRDERTGRQVALVAGVPTMTRELRATIRLTGNAKAHDLREGDTCDDGQVAYRVDRLSLDPVAVAVLTKVGPDHEGNETLLLRPDNSDAGDSAKGARSESSSQFHPLHNGP